MKKKRAKQRGLEEKAEMIYCKRCGALDHYQADCTVESKVPTKKKAKKKAKGKKQ